MEETAALPDNTNPAGHTDPASAGAPHLRVLPDPDPSEPSRSAEDVNRLLAWIVTTFRPPAVWSERPLAARELLEAARHHPGPAHRPRRAYAFLAALVTAFGVGAIWIVQHPAVLLAAFLLVTAVVGVPLAAVALA